MEAGRFLVLCASGADADGRTQRRAGARASRAALTTLARRLDKRADDVLAYFDRPGISNGPTEAINGRLEYLRGSASGSATSPTTPPDHGRDRRLQTHDYTFDCEEPIKQQLS